MRFRLFYEVERERGAGLAMRVIMVAVAVLCVLFSAADFEKNIEGKSTSSDQPNSDAGWLMDQLVATPMRSDLWLDLYAARPKLSGQVPARILSMAYITGGESPTDLPRRLQLLATLSDLKDPEIVMLAKSDVSSMLRLGVPYSEGIDTAYGAANEANRAVILEIVETIDSAYAARLREEATP